MGSWLDRGISSIGARLLTTRRFVRAPIAIFRHGGGWLFGPRVLMLEHTGRVSGQPRYVCLEVVERPAANRVFIVSGFGASAQWYRNLRADPDCFVSIAHLRRIPAHARFLSEDESVRVLQRYQERRPRDWEVLRGAIEKAVQHDVFTLPVIELQLRSPSPT